MKNLMKIAFVGIFFITALFAYEPTLEVTKTNGVELYLLPEDGEANEDGVIDQFWLEQAIQNNSVPKGLHIIDIRKKEKYDVQHLNGALNIPFDRENEKIDTSKFPKDGVVVFYCNTGLMSTDARTSLSDEMAERVFVFDVTYKCEKDTHKNCELTPNEAL